MKMYSGLSHASSPTTTTTTQESTDETSISSDGRKSPGMLSYETAALYIRRKSRERRSRNQTIAVTEDAWQRSRFYVYEFF